MEEPQSSLCLSPSEMSMLPLAPPKEARKIRERSKFTLTVATKEDTKRCFLFTSGNGELGQLGLGIHYLQTKYPMWVKIDYDIVSVQAGGFHSVCLTKKGEILTFGDNEYGSLGRPTVVEHSGLSPDIVQLPGKAIQITAGEYHTVALLENGSVYAWGDFKDSYGTMGLTLDGCQRTPVLVFSNEQAVKIASGANHFVVLTKEGNVYTMGCSEFGQLGRVPKRSANRYCRKAFERQLALFPIYMKLNTGVSFADIWAGGNSTFAKVSGSTDIYVFGCNTHRQLGTNVANMVYTPTVSPNFSQYTWRDIKCDNDHTIGLEDSGRIFVIGRQENGCLGIGTETNNAPILTEVLIVGDHDIRKIGVGYGTSFTVTYNGGLLVWGDGSSGQLGTGDYFDRRLPYLLHSKALEGTTVMDVSGGCRHTIILAHHMYRPYYLMK